MRILCLLIVLTTFTLAEAQQTLTVEDAVNIALKNNFDILVAHNQADIARVNNTAGNAGMLPDLQINGSGTYEVNNTVQKLASGSENKYPALSSTLLSAGTGLSWTLFDGGKMFVTKNKLNEIEALGEIGYRDKVLQTVYEVTAAYYDVVRQKQELKSIREVMRYNQERVKIAQTGFDAGSLAKTDLLQARIDLNVVTENAINQEFAIDVARKNLMLLLGQKGDTLYEVMDSISFQEAPDRSLMLQKIDSANTSILMVQKQVEIERLALKEYNRAYLPVVNFKAGYYLSQTVNSDGSVLRSHTTGPQVGGSIAIPLYSAGENRRKTAAAKLQLQSAEYDYQNVKLQINTELQNTLTTYENQLRLMQIEKENNALSRENFEICIQRLRLGQTTSLEVHQAQESYVQSSTRLINFEYNLKVAETRLKQLMATL
jgi:outer membrane protein